MSKARGQHAGGMFDRPGRLITGATIVVILLWITFTAGLKLQEMLVGLAATALTMAFFANVLRTETLSVDVQLHDLALAWRLPADILKDCWLVTAVLFRDLFGQRSAGSYYRAFGFPTSRKDPVLVGRSALAVVYTTMSPNVLVIGIDAEQSLMVFHQLQRAELSELTRTLGGQR